MKAIVEPGDILAALCKLNKQWGMYVSFFWEDSEDMDEVCKAAPYLDDDKLFQVRMAGHGYLFFDTQEEMEKHYNLTVGDDGPTHLNSYKGDARVYALTCNPDGKWMNENT